MAYTHKNKDEYSRDLPVNADWYNLEQACVYLDITRETFTKLRKQGKIPVSKLGQIIRVKKADMDAFLESLPRS